MLTIQLIRKFNKMNNIDAKTCPFCKKIIDPNNQDTEYIRSKVNDRFFHRSCFVRAYKESIK